MALGITSITPSTGVTSGHDRIVIHGTDFDMNPWPPAAVSGPVGDLPDPLRVKIGDLYATNVWVYERDGGAPGEFTIECNTPRYIGNVSDLPRAVDVTVENLLNPGSVTSSGGFTYTHPDVKQVTTYWSYRVVKTLLLELMRQIPFESVVQSVHTDYDSSTAGALNTVDLAKVPALIVSGPRVSRSHGAYHIKRRDDNSDGSNERRYDWPTTVDMGFDLLLVDNHKGRLLSLLDLVTIFPEENGNSLQLEKVVGDPSQGFHALDMDWETFPQFNPEAGRDSISTASASIVIRGVPVERPSAIELQKVYVGDEDTLALTFEQML